MTYVHPSERPDAFLVVRANETVIEQVKNSITERFSANPDYPSWLDAHIRQIDTKTPGEFYGDLGNLITEFEQEGLPDSIFVSYKSKTENRQSWLAKVVANTGEVLYEGWDRRLSEAAHGVEQFLHDYKRLNPSAKVVQ